jgi:hypothetical protein
MILKLRLYLADLSSEEKVVFNERCRSFSRTDEGQQAQPARAEPEPEEPGHKIANNADGDLATVGSDGKRLLARDLSGLFL